VTPNRYQNLLCSAALLLGLSLFGGCNVDLTPCESDVDCVIVCECPNRNGVLTVGPFVCRAGTCGLKHAEERDCSRVCGTQPGYVPPPADDDDSSAGDDDDSGR
jgi:hypothetical protein